MALAVDRTLLIGLLGAVSVLILAVGVLAAFHAGSSSGRPGVPAAAPSPSAGATGPHPPAVLAPASGGTAPTRKGVAHAVAGPMKNPDLGRVGVAILDGQTGSLLYGRHPDAAVLPASVTKLTTATAILRARGPGYRMQTRVVAGRRPGQIVLVGGGDPTLVTGAHGIYPGAARLDRLAAATKKALHGHKPTRVTFDSSLFGGRTTGPNWDADILPSGDAAPITALMTNSGIIHPGKSGARYPHPDRAAARTFAHLLGVPAGKVHRGRVSGHPKQLASVSSPPLSTIVHIMLQHSDNTIAETLAHQVAVAHGKRGSYSAGAAAVTGEMKKLGLTTSGRLHLADGSGLSRSDRIAPRFLARLLATVGDGSHPRLWPVFTGLPVAGYSGTLWFRYRHNGAERGVTGLLRAKTGSLSGTSTLAGMVLDSGGRLVTFTLMAEHITNNVTADAAMDRVATAVAHCGCHRH